MTVTPTTNSKWAYQAGWLDGYSGLPQQSVVNMSYSQGWLDGKKERKPLAEQPHALQGAVLFLGKIIHNKDVVFCVIK